MLKGTKHTEESKKKIGMSSKGRKHTDKTKRKISKKFKGKNHPLWGKHHTEEAKRKMSEKKKGKNHPFYGKHHTEETKKKIGEANSEANKGYRHTKEAKIKMSEKKKGKNHPLWGKHLTKETKRKMSEANKGNKNWLGKHHTEETKRKISEIRRGYKHTKETKRKLSKSVKQLWQNSEYRNETVKAQMLGNQIKPNKPELQLQGILNELYPNDWQYVGDGKVILNGFCPDFININGKKQIIEMNGDYWHNRANAKEKDPRKIETYKQLGYDTLVIWESELKNVNNVKNKIQEFCV